MTLQKIGSIGGNPGAVQTLAQQRTEVMQTLSTAKQDLMALQNRLQVARFATPAAYQEAIAKKDRLIARIGRLEENLKVLEQRAANLVAKGGVDHQFAALTKKLEDARKAIDAAELAQEKNPTSEGQTAVGTAYINFEDAAARRAEALAKLFPPSN